eukprot:3535993-Amphidinium_carterae.1
MLSPAEAIARLPDSSESPAICTIALAGGRTWAGRWAAGGRASRDVNQRQLLHIISSPRLVLCGLAQ